MKKKILIISNSFPNFGGQPTTAYNLLKLLKKDDGIDTRLIFINYVKQSDTDPENTGSAHKIALKKSIPYKLYHWYKNKYNIDPQSLSFKFITKTKDLYLLVLLIPRLLYFIISNRFSPDLVITNIPVYYTIIRRIFNPRKMLVIVGSCSEMYDLSKHHIDAQSVLHNNRQALQKLKNHKSINYAKTNVIFNSSLTQQVYQALNIKTGSSSVQYFNLAPASVHQQTGMQSKQYDLAFISSNFERIIKNVPLAQAIFSRLQQQHKIAIGSGSNLFSNIPNTTLSDIIAQQEISDILVKTRLLIITSYFDSSPGILSEAILNGCNVLVSKNVGWHDQLDERCVVNDYNNIEEWTTKATYLMQNSVSYDTFEAIINDAEHNITASIKALA